MQLEIFITLSEKYCLIQKKWVSHNVKLFKCVLQDKGERKNLDKIFSKMETTYLIT